MNKQLIEKIKASRKATRARLNSQTIQVDENWRIVRIDEYNWQIQRLQKNEETKEMEWRFWPRENFYGKLKDALRTLPDTLIHVEAKNSLAELIESGNGILARIEKTISRLERNECPI